MAALLVCVLFITSSAPWVGKLDGSRRDCRRSCWSFTIRLKPIFGQGVARLPQATVINFRMRLEMAVVDPVRVLVCQDVSVVGTRDASVDVILSWPFTRYQGTTNELSQASLKTRRWPHTVVPAKLVLENKGNWNPVPWTVFQPTDAGIRLF